MPSANQSRILIQLDDELFRAYQTGDHGARDALRKRLGGLLYSTAYAMCCSFGLDEHDAQSAYIGALDDADKKLAKGFQWDGRPRFVGYLMAHVSFHCRRARREHYRWLDRHKQLLGDTEEGRTADLERLAAPVEPNQGVEMQMRERIAEVVTTLAAWREMCRKRKALRAVLDAQLEYVRCCVAKSVSGVPPGRDCKTMPLDELLPYLNPEAHKEFQEFDPEHEEMNLFIMERIKITPNALYLRHKRIREMVGAPARRNM